MRIVFDAFWWNEGPISNRNVMQEIIKEWHVRFPLDEMHVITEPSASAQIAVELSLPHDQVHAVRIRQHGLAVLLDYPRIFKRIKPDHIFTHNFVPLFTQGASAFVHDLIFVTSPQWFTRNERFYFWFLKRSLSSARQLFSSTDTEAARISSLTGVKRDVKPTGLAVSTELAAAKLEMPALGLEQYGFSLIVGRLNERKNLAYGLEVLADSGLISPENPVVVVGEKQGKASELPPDVATLVDSAAVRFVGFMKPEELAWLYSKASLVIFPTLDEGFGLPVIEARYFGAPLALSDIPVLREVAGDAEACFFSLDNKQGAAATLGGARKRTSASNDARSRDSVVKQYSWTKTVDILRGSILETIANDLEQRSL